MTFFYRYIIAHDLNNLNLILRALSLQINLLNKLTGSYLDYKYNCNHTNNSKKKSYNFCFTVTVIRYCHFFLSARYLQYVAQNYVESECHTISLSVTRIKKNCIVTRQIILTFNFSIHKDHKQRGDQSQRGD